MPIKNSSFPNKVSIGMHGCNIPHLKSFYEPSFYGYVLSTFIIRISLMAIYPYSKHSL